MANLQLSDLPEKKQPPELPEEWQPKYVIKRYSDEPIEITPQERDFILLSLNKGDKFIFLRSHDIVLVFASVSAIEPKFGRLNIPPRPKEIREFDGVDITGEPKYRIVNKKTLELWDRLFGQKSLEG